MDDLSRRVIGGALTYLKALGTGVLDKVQENASAHERRKVGLAAKQPCGLTIIYDGIVVGGYAADLIVERLLLVELQAVKVLNEAHHTQRTDYLKTFGRGPPC